MSESFRIRLEKEHHVFSAAHFITFAGNICERLHGHNYGVSAEISGPLDENSYVVDFIAARDALREILDEFEHRVILPDRHSAIRVTADAREVTAVFEDRRWIFPAGDCVILPIANTTAELLAQYIGRRLQDSLRKRIGFEARNMVIAVDENHGQMGIWELRAAGESE